jgi:hypothetical protein
MLVVITFQEKFKSIPIEQSQATPEQNPTKEKDLDFLGFPFPKPAFSMGCADP